MPTSIWHAYTPSDRNPWNLARAKHLHRRAAFGVTWSELQRDIQDGPEKSVERVLSGDSRIAGLRDDFEEMSEVIGDAASGSNDANRLKAWWLWRMLFTPDPLQEKLTLLWHNHFATSNLKVEDLLLMREQNELFRQYATAKFGDLLRAVLRDPAMLYWLDANSNRKGHPNENLARELMELFTLGIGHYSEDDVKQAARALTGWTVKRDQVEFRQDRHDDGEKTILGATKNFDADRFTQLLLDDQATSRHIAWRLCDTLMGERVVDKAAMEELSSGLREHDLDIRWAVETILRSELFFSDANIASRVSSPVEYLLGAVRSLELLKAPPSTLILAEWCTRLGQDLYYPPNVGGWTGGRGWLTSRTIVGRANFAADGRLSVVQGVGYPNPNRSHFRSMAIWQTANLDENEHTGNGWLGEAISTGGLTTGPHAIHVGQEELPVALRGRRCTATTISSPADLKLTLSDLADIQLQAASEADSLSDYLTRSVGQAYASAKELAEVSAESDSTGVRYPDSKLAKRLRLVGQMIKSDAAARVYYTAQGGYDTHAVQLPTHGNLLGELSSSLKAFMNDMRESGLEDRILVMAFSEFGRRVEENASLGTDHGTAGPMFLVGTQLKQRLYGGMPPLTDLDSGDLKYTLDFRHVYAGILRDWLAIGLPSGLSGYGNIELVSA